MEKWLHHIFQVSISHWAFSFEQPQPSFYNINSKLLKIILKRTRYSNAQDFRHKMCAFYDIHLSNFNTENYTISFSAENNLLNNTYHLTGMGSSHNLKKCAKGYDLNQFYYSSDSQSNNRDWCGEKNKRKKKKKKTLMD